MTVLLVTVPLVIGAAETTVVLEFGVQNWLLVLGTVVLLWQLQPGAELVAGAGMTVVVGMNVVVGIVVVDGAKNVACETGALCTTTGAENVAGTAMLVGITATGRKLVYGAVLQAGVAIGAKPTVC